MTTEKIAKSDAEWRAELTPEQYHILREKGTERAFTGALWDEHRPGIYKCAGCGAELFDAATKFESGTGWPSFYQPADADAVGTETDRSFFMTRTEVMCATCGGLSRALTGTAIAPAFMAWTDVPTSPYADMKTTGNNGLGPNWRCRSRPVISGIR